MTTPPLPSRYELLSSLGEGGMGQVFKVLDREAGREIALKRLRVPEGEDDAQARFLFRQEFWAMASLRHPHLVEALDYGEGPDGVPYMTMALVPGEDLNVTRPQHEAAVRSWLPQIAAALAFLHGRGYVHGDLKPENVRIQPDGTALLMDLGLLTPVGRSGEPIKGSISYMAPEVIRQGAIDARSDLYALGAVLYHALTGRPPFAHANTMVVLRAHLDSAPERLQQRNSYVSPEMDAAVMRLLAKEPSARFAGVGDLLAALDLQAEGDEHGGLLASPIIGREAAQAALRDLWAPVASGEPGGRRWLSGPAGAGKSRLLGEARADAQLAGVGTISIQGLGADAAPYQALQPFFRSLAGAAEADLVVHGPVLARVLPDLAVAPAAPLDGVSERLRLQAAVAALARAAHPRALWLVDAADALDPASLELLMALQREATAAWAWAWAGEAARPAGAGNASEGPAGAAVTTLEPLADEAILAIARQQLGQNDLPAGLADWLVPLAAGAPGAVGALLGHWLETGALRRVAGRWQAAGNFELPGGLRVALDARLAALGEDARQVARTAAVLGAAERLALLAGVAGLADDRFFAALRELVGAGVLDADERTFRFTRATQAVALAASWDEAERRQRHDAAADWLLADLGRGPDDAGVSLGDGLAIAHHALAGATPRRAVPWVCAAVTRAIAQFTLEPADALLRPALAIAGLAEDERLELERLQVNVIRHLGRGKEAASRYEEADLLARLARREDPTLADETTSYGATLSVTGRYDDAKRVLAEAIALADAAEDRTTGVRARIYAGRAAYFTGDAEAARALMAEAVALGREAHAAGKPANLAVALSFYGYFLASAGKIDEGLAALSRAVEVARESGNPVQTNEALSMRGNVCLAEGRPIEAREAFEAILSTCRQFDLPYDELMARLNLSSAWLEMGDAHAANDHATQVVAAAQASQRKFPEAFARVVAGRARLHLGELAAGEAEMAAGLTIARDIQNRYLELHALVPYIDGLIALGRREPVQGALADARRLATELSNTEHDAALERLEMKAALQNALAADAPLTALAAVGERLAGWAARLRASGRLGDLAHALHLQAIWAVRVGDMPAGTAWSDEAQALAEQAGLHLLAAEVGYTRARLAFEAGLSKVAVDGYNRSGERAEELGDIRLDLLCTAGALAAQGLHRERATIAKRFEGLTKGLAEDDVTAYLEQPDLGEVMRTLAPVGLSIAARDLLSLMASFDGATALPRLLRRAVATMVQFAGAQRGFLLLFEDLDVTHKVYYGMSEDEADEFSASLAYQVLWTQQPMFVEDAQSDRFFSQQASVRALDLRSIVGVPLAVDGEVIGVMIGDSRNITAGFGDYHLEMLEALARRVASAIGAARKRAEEERQASLAAMLGRVALATAGCADLASFMAPVAAEALALAGADRLCLVVGPELVCQVAYDSEGRELPAADQAPSQSACRWVFEHGEPLHLHDVQASGAFGAQRSVMALGLRTIHAVPVAFGGKTLGVLYLDDRRVGREDPHVTEALRQLGSLVGALLTRSAPR